MPEADHTYDDDTPEVTGGGPEGGGTEAEGQEYRPGTRWLAWKSLGPGLRGPWASTGGAPKRMLGEGPVPTSLEDGEAGPHKEAGAPCGLAVRIPAHRAARRGGQAL